jgi:hypothetical protein
MFKSLKVSFGKMFYPEQISNLDVSIWSIYMKLAKLRVFWKKSPSLKVLQYNVIVINEDSQEVLENRSVSFAESQVMITVPQDTNITVTVIANDGLFDSEPVSISYSVGNLLSPEPIGSLGVEVVEILEPVEEVAQGGDYHAAEDDEDEDLV